MADYLPSAPVNDEVRKRNQNLPGQGGVFNYITLHCYAYAGNNPIKYTGPTGEYDIDDFEQYKQQQKIEEQKLLDERLTYVDIGLPERGPCNMRALIAIAESYTGKNLSVSELTKLINNLTTGSNPLVTKGNNDYYVNWDTKVVGAAIDAIWGEGTSKNLNIVITRPEDIKNYQATKESAIYSLRSVGTRSNSSTAGHWQVGDSKGSFLWDPLSGTNNGGRKLFENDTRYIIISPKLK